MFHSNGLLVEGHTLIWCRWCWALNRSLVTIIRKPLRFCIKAPQLFAWSQIWTIAYSCHRLPKHLLLSSLCSYTKNKALLFPNSLGAIQTFCPACLFCRYAAIEYQKQRDGFPQVAACSLQVIGDIKYWHMHMFCWITALTCNGLNFFLNHNLKRFICFSWPHHQT